MKKIILIIVIIAVISAGYFIIFGFNDEKIEVLEPPGDDFMEIPIPPVEEYFGFEDITVVTVIYSNNGFSPSVVRITAGTEVVFINQSSQAMWVASNPHPTHSLYPGFDQRGSGDSYSFIFDRSGDWVYHNHLSPFHEGSIIVD